MYDKGKAAVVVMENEALGADGQPLYTTMMSAFIRGEGGWGGDRGPSGPQNVPPERAADHQVTYQTSPDQALVYRLSGDRNPLHSDPSFAAMGGFDTPILHGLCTYGFTGRALLHTLAGSDPSRFHHIEGRFSSPVLPGEALTISMWEIGNGEAVFATAVGDRLVIDQGLVRYS
jgi:acyl dehydratase